MDWTQTIAEWQQLYGLRTYPPATPEVVKAAENTLGPLPVDLVSLYRCSNSLSVAWFQVLPLFDASNVKRTWDSLQ